MEWKYELKKPIEDMDRHKKVRRYDLSIYASKKDTSPKMDVGWVVGGGEVLPNGCIMLCVYVWVKKEEDIIVMKERHISQRVERD